MRKLFSLFSVWMLAVMTLSAQHPYYYSVEGLTKGELKTALHELIQPDYVLSYGGKGEGYTWSGFKAADWMEGGQVRDRYSHEIRYFDGENAVEGMNIEHVFANSWWGHTVNNAYCDLFNLFPSDATANGRKSNNPMGVVTEAPAFDNGVIKVGRSTSYREDSLITVWEPADEWKGDFARTFFYMATCYEDYVDEWQTTEGLLVIERNRYPTLRPWITSLLLQWNDADPVDEIERQRNEVVSDIQGNRNPFVDYPQLADYIWGDSVTYRFYTDNGSKDPVLFLPQKQELLDYGLQAMSCGLQAELTLRGRNLSEGVVLSVDNANFKLDKTSLSGDEVTQGARIRVFCNVSEPGEQRTVLRITGDGFEQTDTLLVDFVDGIPAYEAQDMICNVYTRQFVASWLSMGNDQVYRLDVYTKDKNGDPVSLSGYPLNLSETQHTVTDLKGATTYYYKVYMLDENGDVIMSSNEVEVSMPEVSPIFTANVSEMLFVTAPETPSASQTVKLTALELPENKITVSVEQPFEVSVNGEEWMQNITVSGTNPVFYVRVGMTENEGLLESEMILSTKGVEELVISLSAEIDLSKAFFENFEAGSKSAYAEGEVTCAAATWYMNQTLIGNTAGDRKNGGNAVRMKVVKDNNTYTTVFEMKDDKLNGCDSLIFYAGPYNKDTGAKLTVSYSLDGGQVWIPVVKELTFQAGDWKRYAYYLHVDGQIRLKFEATGTNGKRLNVDDIQMNNYTEGGDGITTAELKPDDVVRVYTVSGIYIRTAKRKDALKGLKPDYYIIK